MNKEKVSISIPKKLLTELKTKANDDKRSLSNFITVKLEQSIKG